MPNPDRDVIESPADLTTAWLSTVLGEPVAEFATEQIGTGQMSECYRVTLTYGDGDRDGGRDSGRDSGTGPGSVVLKVAAEDLTSRQTGLALGLYEREVGFYTDVAPRLGNAVARCYHAGFDPETGVFDLLLADAAPAVVGDEIAGATVEQAVLAVTELGRLHAPLLDDAALAEAPWLNRPAPLNQGLVSALYAGFADRYGDALSEEQRRVCRQFVDSFDGYLADEGAAGRRRGLVHGDYRLDNLLFGTDDAQLTVVDWQTVSWGPALTDLAYFLGGALSVTDRRTHYDELLNAYHRALGADPALSLADIRAGVRRQSFFGVMMAIVSAMLVERTERGDAMFLTLLDRHTRHVLDTEALADLPTPAAVEPLQPEAADETAHPPGAEPLWNESWYFDFADPAQGIGGWLRLGLNPNAAGSWINALVCGPDLPTVALNDFVVPHPADPAAVRAERIELHLDPLTPLQSYRVRATGRGESHDDPAALLRGEPGEPVEAALDLVFTTVGVPYQYRMTPRYEIPCTVSGSIVVGDRRYEITEVPGQRDHSWGVRDWWGMDWVWTALHLDDGTHVHGVDIRLPGAGPIGVGYLQSPGQPLTELHGVRAQETFADNGLPVDTVLTLTPGDVTLTATPVAHAPVTLTADDGRVSEFPRAWIDVVTADGRRGVGWMEWNRNRR